MSKTITKDDRKALSAINTLEPYIEALNKRSSPFGLDPFCCELLAKLRGLKKHIEAKQGPR